MHIASLPLGRWKYNWEKKIAKKEAEKDGHTDKYKFSKPF